MTVEPGSFRNSSTELCCKSHLRSGCDGWVRGPLIMKSKLSAAIVAASAIALALSLSSSANADVLQTLGGVDFSDGQIVGAATFNAANASEPSPFTAFIGSDVASANF